MIIKLSNIEVVGLIKEIYGNQFVKEGANIKPLITCSLSGPARKKLNISGANLRAQHRVIIGKKLELLTKYGKRVDGALAPIVPDENGKYESDEDKTKAETYTQEMTNYMLVMVDIHVELLMDDELPTVTDNYELVFTKLVQKSVVNK